MDIYVTECCDLAHLNGVYNEDSAEQIARFVRDNVDANDGYKCLFAVTTPDEKVLEKTLASIGFVKSFLFPRRNDRPGMLMLWVALVRDIKLKPKAAKRKAAKSKPRRTR